MLGLVGEPRGPRHRAADRGREPGRGRVAPRPRPAAARPPARTGVRRRGGRGRGERRGRRGCPGRRASALGPVDAMRRGRRRHRTTRSVAAPGGPARPGDRGRVSAGRAFPCEASRPSSSCSRRCCSSRSRCSPSLGSSAAGSPTLARGTGSIAVMHLVKERSRSAYTLALVMVVLAMLITVAGANAAMSRHPRPTSSSARPVGACRSIAPGAFEPDVGEPAGGDRRRPGRHPGPVRADRPSAPTTASERASTSRSSTRRPTSTSPASRGSTATTSRAAAR